MPEFDSDATNFSGNIDSFCILMPVPKYLLAIDNSKSYICFNASKFTTKNTRSVIYKSLMLYILTDTQKCEYRHLVTWQFKLLCSSSKVVWPLVSTTSKLTSDVPALAWGQKLGQARPQKARPSWAWPLAWDGFWPSLGYWKAKAVGLGPDFVP